MHRHSAKKLVVALALVGAAVLFVSRRVLPYLAERATYTDGERIYTLERGEGIRYAIWDEPQALGGGVNSPAREARPALAPDGRLLVFAVGELGENAELWMADVVEGEPRDPRPLAGLNSPADDLAPSFGGGALYFASNRAGGQGGFDLYAATYDGFDFGRPAPVGGGINSPSDELDPAPLGTPGLAAHNGRFGLREALAFASNRAQGGRGDLDLFVAAAGGAEGRIDVAAFPGVNSEFDEREPDFDSEGGALYFASDRGDGRDFDLYRSMQELEAWLAPEPLAGLNGADDERGPQVSPEGFELYFSRSRSASETGTAAGDGTGGSAEGLSLAADPGDLHRARSTELFRRPPPPAGWLDLLLLAALLLLALLAWLAQRWEQLDILYKCLLVSVLLHLLLMWLLRDVYPERGEYELREVGGEATYLVRVLSERAAEQGERGGRLEVAWNPTPEEALPDPERIGLSAEEPEAHADLPLAERLERAAPELAPAPRPEVAAAEVAPAETALRAPELADDPEPAAPLFAAAPAPAPALVAEPIAPPSSAENGGHDDAAVPAERQVIAATRSEREAAIAPASPLRRRVTAPAAGEGSAPPAALDLEPSRPGAEAAPGPALAMPAERAPVAVAGAAPVAPLPRPTEFGEGSASARAAPGPDELPVRVQASESAGPPARVRPEAFLEGPALDRRTVVTEAPRAAFRPDPSAEPSAPRTIAASPALVEPAAGPVGAREELGPAPSLALPAARSLALAPERAAGRHAERAGGPSAASAPVERRALAAVAPSDDIARPVPRAPATARPQGMSPLPAAPERHVETPYRSRFGTEKEVAIQTFGGGADTEHAVAEGLAYLARRQSTRGHWGNPRELHPKYRQVAVGNSALALLAFLGAGHTHRSETEHSQTVARAIEWLLAVQDERTGHFGNCDSYGHGIATYALAECFALTRDPALAGPIERAVGQILRNQMSADQRRDPRTVGGWSYYYPDGSIYDGWPRVSISAWQVMALESARIGGLDVPEAALAAARAFIVGSWDPNLGAVRYSHDPDRVNSGYPTLPGSTPAGLFVLSLAGEDIASDRFSAPRNYLLQRLPDGFRYTGEADFVFRAQGNVYFWYYGSLALLRAGGPEWERWNMALKATLLPAQLENGSWPPLDVYADYAGDSDEESIYTTSMCVLTLEVYYRYFTPLLERR